jgi:hypothetical protein
MGCQWHLRRRECALCMDTADWEVNINDVVSFIVGAWATVERLYNTNAHYSYLPKLFIQV